MVNFLSNFAHSQSQTGTTRPSSLYVG